MWQTWRCHVKESYLIFSIPSSNDSFHHDYPKKNYCQLYFEIFDNIINCIKDSFNQTDYQMYVLLHEILIKGFKEQDWDDDLHIVCIWCQWVWCSFIKLLLLLPEIAKFYGLNSRMQLSEMIALFQKLDTIKEMLVAEVIKLVKSILVMPASNAVSKIIFIS